jgi:hypothetical protein
MHTNLEAPRRRVGPLDLDVSNGRLDYGFDVNRCVGEGAQVYPRGVRGLGRRPFLTAHKLPAGLPRLMSLRN